MNKQSVPRVLSGGVQSVAVLKQLSSPSRHPWLGICSVFLIIFLLGAAGCSPKWRAKFIRKSTKSKATAQPILVLQPDQKAVLPPADRYREHYAYWKSWHGDLLDSLGQLRKRDLVQINGAIGELQAMQSVLTGPPSEGLRKILLEMRNLQAQWAAAPVTWQIPSATRTRLQQLYREIDKNYPYARVKNALVRES